MKAYQPLIEKYGRQAASYDRRWNLRWGQATLEASIAAIPWAEAGRALDVGCGTGLLERAVRSRLRPPALLIGLDISIPMLQQARRNLASASRVTLANAPAEHMPFADAAFDLLVCNNSFHYYQNPGWVLQEFRRVLRPGGCLVLTDWCSDFLTTKLVHWALRTAQQAGLHRYSLQHCYSAREMDAMLTAAGFQLETAQQVAMELGWGIAVLRARA